MKKNIEFILTEVFLPHSAVSCRSAFTLAEVLITLGIIGVIAITKYSSCTRTFIYNVTDENGNVVTDEDGNIVQAEGVGHSCFDLSVDTNGNKGPNQIGMDVFGIFVDPDGPEKGTRGDLWNILSDEEINVVQYTPGTPVK